MIFVLVFASVLGLESDSGDRLEKGSVRLVRASASPYERTLALSSNSLYVPNDVWKADLASEAVCPGGERTDLSTARQISTVACLVNFARKRHGLRQLALRPQLNGASVLKAKAIIQCANFAHNPCGGDWKSVVRSTGFKGSFGENLYLANGRWAAPRVVVDAWLNSAGHRANLFGRGWHEQGVAVLRSESFAGYRDVALWVNVLAAR